MLRNSEAALGLSWKDYRNRLVMTSKGVAMEGAVRNTRDFLCASLCKHAILLRTCESLNHNAQCYLFSVKMRQLTTFPSSAETLLAYP